MPRFQDIGSVQTSLPPDRGQTSKQVDRTQPLPDYPRCRSIGGVLYSPFSPRGSDLGSGRSPYIATKGRVPPILPAAFYPLPRIFVRTARFFGRLLAGDGSGYLSRGTLRIGLAISRLEGKLSEVVLQGESRCRRRITLTFIQECDYWGSSPRPERLCHVRAGNQTRRTSGSPSRGAREIYEHVDTALRSSRLAAACPSQPGERQWLAITLWEMR